MTSDKYILDIVTNELRLDFKEIPKSRPYQFRNKVLIKNKKDGGKGMILNLKQFNTHITYHHFKMESINQVIDIARLNVYMASIDLKDAF